LAARKSVNSRGRDAGHGSTGTGAFDELIRALEDVGLHPYEARVLLALLREGEAGSLRLATVSGVPRTSIYPVMKTLTKRGLAEPVPGFGAATWRSETWEAVVDALDAAEENRLLQHHARTMHLRASLTKILPASRDRLA